MASDGGSSHGLRFVRTITRKYRGSYRNDAHYFQYTSFARIGRIGAAELTQSLSNRTKKFGTNMTFSSNPSQ